MKTVCHTLPYILSLMLVVASCGCYKHLPSEQVQRDSTAVHIIDSTVVIFDTVRVHVPHEESSVILPSSDSSHLETGVAESDAFIDSLGQLHHTLKNKDVRLFEVVPRVEHFRDNYKVQHQRSHEVLIREVEKPLTKGQHFWMTLGKLFIGVLSGVVIAIAIRLFLKFKGI